MSEAWFFGGIASGCVIMRLLEALDSYLMSESFEKALRRRDEAKQNEDVQEAVEEPEPESEERASAVTDFSVPDTSRRVPWHIRRKELEAAHKTKRKQYEEYREMV